MAPKLWIDLSSSIRTVVSVPLDHCRLRMLFQQVLSISLTESPPFTSAHFNPFLLSLLLLFYFPATFHLYHSAMLKENCNGTMTLNFFFLLSLYVMNTCVWNGLLLWLSHKIWSHILFAWEKTGGENSTGHLSRLSFPQELWGSNLI